MSSAHRRSARQRVEFAGARVMDALPPRAQLRLAGGVPVRIDGGELDPGLQLVLRLLEVRGDATLRGKGMGVDAARARLRRDAVAFAGPPTAVGAVTELEIDGAAGRLPARHYAPLGTEPRPLLVFLHGGGFVTGDIDTHDEPCRMFCRHANIHVLSVDYRLAPENAFPAPGEDALAALRWAQAHAAELGGDPAAVAIGGDSAGGNLAAVATQMAVREGGPAPALQLLLYPVTDFAEERPSKRLFDSGFFLTRGDMDWFEGHYLADHDPTDPLLSPLRAPDLHGLAPAIVVTAAFDPLRDEGEAYAEAMRDAGVHVVGHRAPGMIHGFVNFTSVNRAARDNTVLIAGMVRAELARAAEERGADEPADASQPATTAAE